LWYIIRGQANADLVRALGVSQTTAKAYRDRLEELALIEVEERFHGKKKVVTIKSVNYKAVTSTLHRPY
jgi:predicted AAA+ superfamily ATPase